MSAVSWLVLGMAVGAAPAPPYQAVATDEDSIVRAGPGEEFYVTQYLPAGTRVEVHARYESGWLAIRPPRGSFDWIPAAELQFENAPRANDGPTEFVANGGEPAAAGASVASGDAASGNSRANVAAVSSDGAVAWIGTLLGTPAEYRWQVRLRRGELVQVLERTEKTTPGGTQSWCKVAPPSGEFRFVHESQIVPPDEFLGPGLNRRSLDEIARLPDERAEETARAAGDANGRIAASVDSAATASRPAGTFDSAGRADSTELNLKTVDWQPAAVDRIASSPRTAARAEAVPRSNTNDVDASGAAQEAARPDPAQTIERLAALVDKLSARVTEVSEMAQQAKDGKPVAAAKGPEGNFVRLASHDETSNERNATATAEHRDERGSSTPSEEREPLERSDDSKRESVGRLGDDLGHDIGHDFDRPVGTGVRLAEHSARETREANRRLETRRDERAETKEADRLAANRMDANRDTRRANVATAKPGDFWIAGQSTKTESASARETVGQRQSAGVDVADESGESSAIDAPSEPRGQSDWHIAGLREAKRTGDAARRSSVRDDSQAADGASGFRPSDDAQRIGAPVSRGIRELETALTELASMDPSQWRLRELRDEATRLIADGETAVERGQARLILERIAEFERLSDRYRRVVADEDSMSAESVSFASATRDDGPLHRRSETLPANYDASGWLLPVHSSSPGAPPFALNDKSGKVIAFVTPAPGLNLFRFVNKEVGLLGSSQFVEPLRTHHVVAETVVELDRHERR